jgi:hypothetical protein
LRPGAGRVSLEVAPGRVGSLYQVFACSWGGCVPKAPPIDTRELMMLQCTMTTHGIRRRRVRRVGCASTPQ